MSISENIAALRRGIAAACGIGWSAMLVLIVSYYFMLKRRGRAAV